MALAQITTTTSQAMAAVQRTTWRLPFLNSQCAAIMMTIITASAMKMMLSCGSTACT